MELGFKFQVYCHSSGNNKYQSALYYVNPRFYSGEYKFDIIFATRLTGIVYFEVLNKSYQGGRRYFLTAEKRKNAYRQNITAVLHYHRNNTAIFWFYRFRPKNTANSGYRQKVPPTLNTAQKVQPTLNTAQKVPPTLNTAQKGIADTGYRKKGAAYKIISCWRLVGE